MPATPVAILCPGQGAQAVGMGKAWFDASAVARETFNEADDTLQDELGARLSALCFEGPAERLNRTDVAQPALYACSVACHRALTAGNGTAPIGGAAGLSLGEYTALHLAGVFDFASGLRLVSRRGRLMQEAAESSGSGMVALIGADEDQARAICDEAAGDEVLVCANFNAPGQIVLSGHTAACERSVAAAERAGIRATPLAVAGAFHSPIMQPAAVGMTDALASVPMQPPRVPVWSNVTARPHEPDDMELLRRRLVEQILSPVRWSEICRELGSDGRMDYHELAPGTVLRGLMRRIDPSKKVMSHDKPQR